MAYKDTAKKTAYQNKYISEAYDRINLTLPKGRKADVKAVADRHGLSVNGYIGKLIEEALEKEQAPGGGFRISEPPTDSNM